MDLGATIEDAVVALFRKAVVRVPPDIMKALRTAESRETHDVARNQLATILRNLEEAERLSLPLCQDTGVPVFFVSGRIPPEVEEGIRRGVVRATREVPLRPNAVHPLTRENPGTNVGEGLPRIVYRPTNETCTFMTVMPKGAGSENMSALAMLAPSEGRRASKICPRYRGGGRG
jgi:fumarate hydratase subunit alpha